ncbi:DUF7527 domain-containing protein [Haladaptatus salinisoli]|uniref:DUF7527 domain-containing protein n=1 Tax=Haladaptatus salinisoli TaxID=2884876 RepID=UPI001D0B1CD9|nr:hypothetical protein [Haladaptatus salinisoli]
MDTRTDEKISEWDSRPFTGGFDALRDLADAEFSGAVRAGGAQLFMLNGRVVGVFGGELDDFEDADGTVFEAPHASLPLLFSMRERGGKTQAKYYTNDTPLAEASDTLAGKNFTGYVELSENVLSGDYYVVYHAGRSMSVAYVGESEQLVSGDEAFERANDEVGIYEVVAADVDVIDIPEPKTPDETPTAASSSDSEGDEPGSESESEPDQPSEPDSEPETTPGSAEPAATAPETERTPRQPTQEPDQPSPRRAASEANQQSEERATASETESNGGASDPLSDEKQWRETSTIPSLDPDKSSTSKSRERGVKQRRTTRRPPQQQSQARAASKRTKELEAELAARAEQIETLRTKLSESEAERDELRQERDRLQSEVERLRDELETVRESAPGAVAERQLTPEQAFAGTNLFVRYGSKGKGTLTDAAAGEVDREAVESNLKLEHHTQFESDGVAVEGREYEAFLHDSMEFQFVSWLVTDLLYEILETGHQRGMKDLFEAIQEVDRAELHGAVTAASEEDEERELSFDVILRDRMGNPLAVANINDSREPATGEMMGSLVDAATDVVAANDELSAAFQVTKSFFEPAALETTEDATSGGLLTREKRESFVKLSRKRGYHLCLVESRNGQFYLTVPEL